jgi:hypothetical protein
MGVKRSAVRLARVQIGLGAPHLVLRHGGISPLRLPQAPLVGEGGLDHRQLGLGLGQFQPIVFRVDAKQQVPGGDLLIITDRQFDQASGQGRGDGDQVGIDGGVVSAGREGEGRNQPIRDGKGSQGDHDKEEAAKKWLFHRLAVFPVTGSRGLRPGRSRGMRGGDPLPRPDDARLMSGAGMGKQE